MDDLYEATAVSPAGVSPSDRASRRLLLFSKPAVPGRVKTRMTGELTAVQAADLHQAFLDDLIAELSRGEFGLEVCWSLEAEQEPPAYPVDASRQRGPSLGARLHLALSEASRSFRWVAAVGSDHPELTASLVNQAFDKLAAGADVVLGPTDDGGYYLVALRAEAVQWAIFQGVAWSTAAVLPRTLDNCRELGLEIGLLPEVADIDTPGDLARLILRLRKEPQRVGSHTRDLLRLWGRIG